MQLRQFVAIVCLYCVAGAAHARTWTDRNGNKIDAVFVRASDSTVVLQKDGRQAEFPISGFSAEDQEFIRSKNTKAKPTALPAPASPRSPVVAKSPANKPTAAAAAENPSDISKPRMWTDSQNRQVKATFVRVKDQQIVLLRGRKILTVPFDKFSRADQELLRTSLAARGQADLLPAPAPVVVAQAPSFPAHGRVTIQPPSMPAWPQPQYQPPQYAQPQYQQPQYQPPQIQAPRSADWVLQRADENLAHMRQRQERARAQFSDGYYCGSCNAKVHLIAKTRPNCGVYFSRTQQPDGTWREEPGRSIRIPGKLVGGVIALVVATIVGIFKGMAQKVSDAADYGEPRRV